MRRRPDEPTTPDVFGAVRQGFADVRRHRAALALRLRDFAADLREAGRLDVAQDVQEAAEIIEVAR